MRQILTVQTNLLFTMIATAVCSGSLVRADDFCAAMVDLATQARLGFTGDPAPLSQAQKCQMVRPLAGGITYHCAWKFPYRDRAARQAFEGFTQNMRVCFPRGIETSEDEGVNHPDSYTQRQHLIDGVRVSLSLKDKGALQETYVFVSVQALSSK